MSSATNPKLLDKIKQELSNLTLYLDGARRGIEGFESTVEVSAEKFPEASRHLKAVTGELENAANNIMTILEELAVDEGRREALLKELSGLSAGLGAENAGKISAIVAELQCINDRVKGKTMEIFTSLSFHDLSGQKIKKVITALSTVEKKILNLGTSLGLPENWWTELNASQTDAPAVSQDGVDEIMKGLKRSAAS